MYLFPPAAEMNHRELGSLERPLFIFTTFCGSESGGLDCAPALVPQGRSGVCRFQFRGLWDRGPCVFAACWLLEAAALLPGLWLFRLAVGGRDPLTHSRWSLFPPLCPALFPHPPPAFPSALKGSRESHWAIRTIQDNLPVFRSADCSPDSACGSPRSSADRGV